MWEIDILGPFPIAMGQSKFVVVSIDYFTKWIDAKTVTTITEQKIQKFFWESMVCRYGIPRVLITDNGKKINNPKFKTFCQELGIEQKFTLVKHPQANGQVEVTKQIILETKEKIRSSKRSMVDEL